MTQADFTIANQTFPNTRTELNTSLQALATNSAGNSAPSTTFANQWWFDSDGNTLYMRNNDNDAWVTILELDPTNDTVEYFKADSIRTALIEFTDGDDAMTIADGGAVTFSQAPVFPDGSINIADLDIDGGTDIGEAIVDADLFIIDNGAGGTNRKVAASRLKTYAGASITGIDDQSSSNDDQITISDTNVIINEDSDDVNFRVEGNLSQALIFVDASMDNVSIVGSEKNSTVAASAASQAFLQGSSSVFRIVGHNAEGATSILHASSTTNTVEPVLNLSKSANASIGSYTCVAHNENIGSIVFTADDGTNLLTPAASIHCAIDAAAGENDMPGRLEFATTKNGAATVTRRMYIYHNGTTQIIPGDSNNGYAFDGSVDSFYPFTNDNNDLGYANLKWDDVYATNGTIQTSDKNIKDNITESDLGLDFVNKLKPVSYKFKNKTRTHYGLISQDIEDLLGDLSKTGTDFAGFIKTQKEDNTKWTEDDPETQDAVLYTSDDKEVKEGIRSVGDIKQKASKEIGHFKHDLGTKKIDNEYTYGLRYEEFISPMIKAIQELSAKVKALEEAE